MRLLRARPLLVDGVLAACLGAFAQWMVWSGSVAGPRVAMAALFLLVGFPLIVRRHVPLVPVALLMTAIVVQSVTTADAAEGAPLLLPALACAYAVAAFGTRRIAVAGLLVTVAGLVVQIEFDPLARTAAQLWAAALFVLLVAAAWLFGFAVQGRREASALQAQTDQAEEAQRAAIAAERISIARELHDMIAHNVSVVVVQSVAAQGILDDQPARAREPLAHIEQSGRQALTELRRLLAVMREQDQPYELREPQPGIAQLATLVDSVRSTGLPVTLQVDGEPPPDSAAVGPSVYRIVQESLTNVLKHAGHARVNVLVCYGAAAVEVIVEDDGPGRSANSAAQPGHGLVGMRERAALFGGTFTAGNRDGGGFEVRAHLPLTQTL
ncbi:MAG: sensor histidine kinase [Streptosporangiaceae bacterium]